MYHWASRSALSLLHKENLQGTLNIISNRGKMRVSHSLSQTQTPNPMFNANPILLGDNYRWLYFKEYSKVYSSEILQDTLISIHLLQQYKNTIYQESEKKLSFVYKAEVSEKHMPSLPVWRRTSNPLSSLANLSKNQNNFHKRLTRTFGWNLVLKKFLKIYQALGIVLSK